jgi:hypothetical protein
MSPMCRPPSDDPSPRVEEEERVPEASSAVTRPRRRPSVRRSPRVEEEEHVP